MLVTESHVNANLLHDVQIDIVDIDTHVSKSFQQHYGQLLTISVSAWPHPWWHCSSAYSLSARIAAHIALASAESRTEDDRASDPCSYKQSAA